jgi:hypothetical protein
MINVPNSNLMDKICLSSFIYDQIENPIATLKSFFTYKDLQSHLKQLKQWRNVVETHAHFEIDTFSSPIFEHKMICNLINVAYLLDQDADTHTNELKNLSTKAQEKYLNHECLMGVFVKHLSTAELIDPFLVIKEFFDEFSIEFYHQELYQWLSIGMSPNVVIENRSISEKVFRNLRRLVEACWLIYKRDSNPSFVLPVESQIEEIDNKIKDDEVSEQALSSFMQFLSIVPPNRLNSGLRKMLIDYLFYNMDGLPTDFEEMLSDFYWLTEFLDEIQGKEVDPKFL